MERDNGSFYNQEKLLDKLDNDRDHQASEQAKMRTSCVKVLLQETVKAEELGKEKWTKGRSIIKIWLKFGENVVRMFTNKIVSVNSDYSSQ